MSELEKAMFCKFCDGFSVFCKNLNAATKCSKNGPQSSLARKIVKGAVK